MAATFAPLRCWRQCSQTLCSFSRMLPMIMPRRLGLDVRYCLSIPLPRIATWERNLVFISPSSGWAIAILYFFKLIEGTANLALMYRSFWDDWGAWHFLTNTSPACAKLGTKSFSAVGSACRPLLLDGAGWLGAADEALPPFAESAAHPGASSKDLLLPLARDDVDFCLCSSGFFDSCGSCEAFSKEADFFRNGLLGSTPDLSTLSSAGLLPTSSVCDGPFLPCRIFWRWYSALPHILLT